jgi:hypothetical protein
MTCRDGGYLSVAVKGLADRVAAVELYQTDRLS